MIRRKLTPRSPETAIISVLGSCSLGFGPQKLLPGFLIECCLQLNIKAMLQYQVCTCSPIPAAHLMLVLASPVWQQDCRCCCSNKSSGKSRQYVSIQLEPTLEVCVSPCSNELHSQEQRALTLILRAVMCARLLSAETSTFYVGSQSVALSRRHAGCSIPPVLICAGCET